MDMDQVPRGDSLAFDASRNDSTPCGAPCPDPAAMAAGERQSRRVGNYSCPDHAARRPAGGTYRFLHASRGMLPRCNRAGPARTAGRKLANNRKSCQDNQFRPRRRLAAGPGIAFAPLASVGLAADARVATSRNCSSSSNSHARSRTCRTGRHPFRPGTDAHPRHLAAFRPWRASSIGRQRNAALIAGAAT